jgi:hypothetical protein
VRGGIGPAGRLFEERAVDQLDVDAAILDRLRRVGDLDQPAGGASGSVKWLGSMNFADMA